MQQVAAGWQQVCTGAGWQHLTRPFLHLTGLQQSRALATVGNNMLAPAIRHQTTRFIVTFLFLLAGECDRAVSSGTTARDKQPDADRNGGMMEAPRPPRKRSTELSRSRNLQRWIRADCPNGVVVRCKTATSNPVGERDGVSPLVLEQNHRGADAQWHLLE